MGRRQCEIWFAQTLKAAHFPFVGFKSPVPSPETLTGYLGLPQSVPSLVHDPLQFGRRHGLTIGERRRYGE